VCRLGRGLLLRTEPLRRRGSVLWTRRRWRGGEGPALAGVTRAVAEVHDSVREGVARSVEDAAREARLAGRPEHVGGLGECSGGDEEAEEPTRAAVDLARLGRRLDEGGVAQRSDREVTTLEDEPKGRRAVAEVGLDHLQAAQASWMLSDLIAALDRLLSETEAEA
jgi:hypothetical protein